MRWSFILLFLTLFSLSSLAQLEIPDHMYEHLTESEIDAFESLSYEELVVLERQYNKFMTTVEGSAPGFEQKLYQKAWSFITAGVRTGIRRVGEYIHSLGVTESYVQDLERAFFKHPKAFLLDSSKGVFVQFGLSMAAGIPRRLLRSRGRLLLIGVSIFKVKNGNMSVQFHLENLKLEKLYTPTAEITTLLNFGYESIRLDSLGKPPETSFQVSRDLLPGGVISGDSDTVTQRGFNPSPIAFPTFVTSVTASRYSGKRRVVFSLEITNKLARRLPFFKKLLGAEKSFGLCSSYL